MHHPIQSSTYLNALKFHQIKSTGLLLEHTNHLFQYDLKFVEFVTIFNYY